jgi:hypothetical protein
MGALILICLHLQEILFRLAKQFAVLFSRDRCHEPSRVEPEFVARLVGSCWLARACGAKLSRVRLGYSPQSKLLLKNCGGEEARSPHRRRPALLSRLQFSEAPPSHLQAKKGGQEALALLPVPSAFLRSLTRVARPEHPTNAVSIPIPIPIAFSVDPPRRMRT